MDIIIKNENCRFEFKAAGVLINRKYPSPRERNGNEYALLGGAVKLCESEEISNRTNIDKILKRLVSELST